MANRSFLSAGDIVGTPREHTLLKVGKYCVETVQEILMGEHPRIEEHLLVADYAGGAARLLGVLEALRARDLVRKQDGAHFAHCVQATRTVLAANARRFFILDASDFWCTTEQDVDVSPFATEVLDELTTRASTVDKVLAGCTDEETRSFLSDLAESWSELRWSFHWIAEAQPT